MAKKLLSVTLYMSELIYDVQNKTYLTGRSRYSGDNHEFVANMQANDDDENANQVIRSIGNSFATLKTKLSEYLSEEGTTADDRQVDGETNFTIALYMPSNYNRATRDTIAAALHQYIVNNSIADWFIITNKGDASDYVALANACIQQIREALNKRVRPERPTPWIVDDGDDDTSTATTGTSTGTDTESSRYSGDDTSSTTTGDATNP